MKKILTATIALFGLSTTANAQIDMRFGPKAGVNLAAVSNTDGNASLRTAYYVGAVAEFKFTNRFSIQPELMYSAQGVAEYEIKAVPNNLSIRQKNDYITIPVLAKYYIVSGLSLEMGPQIGFLVNSKQKALSDLSNREEVDTKSAFKSTDFLLAMGVSYDLPMGVFFNIRYNLGLTDIAENNENDMEGKNHVIQIGAGYKF